MMKRSRSLRKVVQRQGALAEKVLVTVTGEGGSEGVRE
jgi:hypothetical protein